MNATTLFRTFGPFQVPTVTKPGGKEVDKRALRERFWIDCPAGKDLGCYVFAVRAGKGQVPWYAGKATKTFQKEVFTPDKLRKYESALRATLRGTPVLYFLSLPNGAGRPNLRAIDELEKVLIRRVALLNAETVNKHHTKEPNWGIDGVLRNARARPTRAAQALKTLLKF